MATAKKSPAGSKTVHTAELTTSQLVLAVCTFLIVLLGVFLLGIIVGEYQYKLRNARAGVDSPDVTTPERPGEGRQPGGFADAKRDAAAPAHEAAPEPFRSQKDSSPSSVVVAAPSPTGRAVAAPAPVTRSPLPTSTAAGAAPAAPAARTTPNKPGPIALEPIEADQDAADADADSVVADAGREVTPIELLPDEPSPVDTKPTAPAAPTVKGQKIYSVQIAALSEPKNADAIKKRVEASTPWPVDIQPNATKKLQIVLVGRFATESEAEQARDELRKKPEFSKAFVSSRTLE